MRTEWIGTVLGATCRHALALVLVSLVALISTAGAADPDDIVGAWGLEITREQMSGPAAISSETLRIERDGESLVATLETAAGRLPVRKVEFKDGALIWEADSVPPGADEATRERRLRAFGPVLYYKAEVYDRALEGLMWGYFGAAEFIGMKEGSGARPSRIASPSYDEATPGGEAFTWLREETFSIGGQTHSVQIYPSNLFAKILGLAPGATDIAAEFVLVPGGSFLMGTTPETRAQLMGTFATEDFTKDESPQRQVTIAPFLLARTELTQALWEGLAHLNGLDRRPFFFQNAGASAPAEMISWNDAQIWLRGVNDAFDLDLRLPSEAEWEYAARAGTTTPLYNGKFPTAQGRGGLDSPNVSEIAWYVGNAAVSYEGGMVTANYRGGGAGLPKLIGTNPVGGKLPNAFGLHDMLGNVYEWCADIANGSYEGAPTDGRPWRGGQPIGGTLLNGPTTEQGPIFAVKDHSYVNGRIRRGGSWRNFPYNTRAGVRAFRGPNFADANQGFRVAAPVPDSLKRAR